MKVNPLTDHLHHQGVTYIEHWKFAMCIASRLLASAFVFTLHAALPFLSIQPRFDLEATIAFLAERNHFIETSAAAVRGQTTPFRMAAKPNRHNPPALA